MKKWSITFILRLSPRPLFFNSISRGLSSAFLKSHYETLKLNPSASLKEIKDAYFKLSKQYHPDLHPNDPKSHECFIKLQEAYKILSNPDSRRDYDAKLRNKPSPKYQRPYGYPDFTQRDEWLKQEQMRRQYNSFRQDFENNMKSSEFNRYYSRPHNLSPEELDRFHKYKRFIKNDKFVYIIFGGVLMFALFESIFVSNRRDDFYWNQVNHGTHYQKMRYYHPSEEELRMLDRNLARDDTYNFLLDRRNVLKNYDHETNYNTSDWDKKYLNSENTKNVEVQEKSI